MNNIKDLSFEEMSSINAGSAEGWGYTIGYWVGARIHDFEHAVSRAMEILL